jgi:7,8-dihydroneopterin aldolase/epimerase/oxygenase
VDIIFIKQLKLDALIGVNAWERRIRQAIVVDLEMGADIRVAAATDAIADTLDYKAVSKRVSAIVEQSGFQLVESLAERIAAALMDEFAIVWLRLVITKPGAVRGSAGVGVMIERGARI